MDIIYELGKNYIITDDITDEKLLYMKQMIIDNKIEGLLECNSGLYNNREVIKYDISNMISVQKKYEKKEIDSNDIIMLLTDITNGIKAGRDFLLDERCYLLDPQYIFSDMLNNKIRLLYLPCSDYNESHFRRYYLLADFFIERLNHKDERAVDIGYSFYRLSKEENFSLDSFLKKICKEEYTDKKNVGSAYAENDILSTENDEKDMHFSNCDNNADTKQRPVKLMDVKDICFWAIAFVMLVVSITLLKKNTYTVYLRLMAYIIIVFEIISIVVRIIRSFIMRKKQIQIPNYPVKVEEYWYDDGETKFFDDELTQLYDTSIETKACLEIHWIINNEEKHNIIEKYPCIIGKKYDAVNICISDDSVSRIHASIVCKGSKILLKDLGSTNGTFVDGSRLLKNEEVEIGTNSQIRFGKVEAYVV